MTPRRGLTLIELLAVMPALAAIMAATGVLLHFVLQTDAEIRRQTRTVTDVGRLAEQFRRDVHESRGGLVVSADHRALELRLPGGATIAWRTEEQGEVVRTQRTPAAADREDSFTLPEGTTAALELPSRATLPMVAIRLQSSGTGGPSFLIEAIVSRDCRWSTAEDKP